MNIGKLLQQRWAAILFVSSFAVAGATMLTVGTASLAMFVSWQEANENAGVANVGVEVLELIAREDKYWSVNKGPDKNLTVDHTMLIPGFDIAGPHLSLKLNSEVSYRLFLKVTQPKQTTESDSEWTNANGTVSFAIDSDVWELSDAFEPVENEDTKTITYTYEYIYADDASFFRAGTVYDFTDENQQITILKDDKITVSQNYNKPGDDEKEFNLKFEAFVQQTLE